MRSRVFVVLLVAACNKSTPASSPNASGTAPEAGPKVALLLSTLQEERYQKDKKYFEDAAKKLGLVPFTLAADNDNARQLAQVEDAISRGAKVLVIQPTDSSAAASYVARAHEKGVKVVAYDRAIKTPSLDFYVSHDSYKVGVIEAEAAIKATGGKGNYVLLNGQSGHSVASEIARGYAETLKPYVDKGAIKVVVERNHDSWSPEQSLKTVEDAITKTKGDIQAILANNSGMARGAVQAVQAAGLGGKGIFIAGADADAANVNYVCEGKQSIEVIKEIKPLAERAAEVAAGLAKGTPIAGGDSEAGSIKVAAVAVNLVDKSNAKQLIVDSGFHTAAEVPACK